MRRIGVLMNLSENDPDAREVVTTFVKELQRLGWSDGRNARIETRWGAGDRDHYRRLAAELTGLAPDIVLAVTTDVVMALQQASQATSIVFVAVINPIGSGLVASMARPSGNATGFTVFEYAIAAKWLELLKEIAPSVTRVAVLRDANVASGIGRLRPSRPSRPSVWS